MRLPGAGEKLYLRVATISARCAEGRAKPVNTEGVERLAGLHQVGMEPDVIAERILQGMRENQTFIFPMPDHKEELAEHFEEVLGYYRDYPQDPGYEQRIAIEAMRRQGYKEQREAARKAV